MFISMTSDSSDSSPKPPVAPPVVNPIPAAGMTEIFGLLEILDDRKGREKIYTLARDLNFEFGSLLLIVKAAEMLDFVYTPGTDIVLKSLGKKMIETDINSKKKILLNQLRKLSLFAYLRDVLLEQEDHRIKKQEFLELIHQALPQERIDQLFDTIINWGRWAEFLGFSQDDDHVYLDQG
jgi:NitT/TauT family transport system ATP-binding protein